MKKISSLFLLFVAFGFANEPNSHGERNARLDMALQECKTSLQWSNSSTTRPDMTQMEQCMSAKGFQKPPRMNTPHGQDKFHTGKENQNDVSKN